MAMAFAAAAKVGQNFKADPDAERVKTVLFITIPPDYLAERADYFARNGIDGFMMAGIMSSWQDDIWQQPSHYTPDVIKCRIVGEKNPLWLKCRAANDKCRQAGINYNSIKVAFYKNLPDWFDNAAWQTLTNNFRQCAVFARSAKFSGITLDIEYIAEMYQLSYPAYQVAGYPKTSLREQARKRGYEIMAAMLQEFPDMIFWLLPECMDMYGPLASDLFTGMVRAMADKKAPGGIHVGTERTYTVTKPKSLLGFCQMTDLKARRALAESGDQAASAYWLQHGSISPGLWPLGYYRDILDANGKLIGYAGKKEKFGDKIIGSYSDKSENYSADEFRLQYGAARSIARKFTWLYCHGQVLWQMSKQEMRQYHASANDTLPVAENLEQYLSVLRDKKIIDDPSFTDMAMLVREHKPVPRLEGFVPSWHLAGPFAFDQKKADQVITPTRTVDLSAEISTLRGKSRWATITTDTTGYIDLARLYGNKEMPLAHAVAWVENPKNQKVSLGFGFNDCAAVFVNDALVYSSTSARMAMIDDEIIHVTLPAGRSKIMVQCGDRGGSNWGFYLRVTDDSGKTIPGLKWQ
jgi:hypothetical protein